MQLPVKRTVVSLRDYARAVIKAWYASERGFPARVSVAVLYAQYMIETGGRACWNWNIGNAKHVDGDGYDYIELSGVWEGVHPFVAARLIASGEAREDKNPVHVAAVGPNKVPIIFNPPHPATRFRAYPDLDTAMVSHLRLLKGRFAPCWPDVVRGDYRGFAHSLKAGRDGKEDTADDYFTANADAYAKGMASHFALFCSSPVYEEEMGKLLANMDAPTDSIPPDSPTVPVEVPEMRPDPLGHVDIVHPRVPLGRPALDGENDPEGNT